ncbi:MAG: hypothetical protein ACQETH_08280 [Candidatus Rifleibacteriota bacterium]
MSENCQKSENSIENNEINQSALQALIERAENEFDWNLIGLVSIWVFLLITFFLIL